MFLIPETLGNRVVCVFTLFLLSLACSPTAFADTLFTKDTVKYGKIVAVDNNDVSIAEGCDTQRVKTISIKSVKLMRFNEQCTVPPGTTPGIGGFNLDSCTDDESQIVFVVSFGNRQRAYASEVEFKAGEGLIINLVNSNEKLRGPIDKVKLIDHICIEKRYIPTTSTYPKEFSKL
jgi:hypothetical protein